MNTCIFFTGPHVSVTRIPSPDFHQDNVNNNMIITYEPITNVGHYPAKLPTSSIQQKELKLLANFAPFSENKEREQLKVDLGQKILDGASRYIPDLKKAIINEVAVGFVKMFSSPEDGNSYLYSANSLIHQRREDGIQYRDLAYISFSGVKMTYTFKTAQTVVQLLKNELSIQNRLNALLHEIINHNNFDQNVNYKIRSAVLKSLTAFLLSQFKIDATTSTGTVEQWFEAQKEKINNIALTYSAQIARHYSRI
jgi:hypothetical protein